jgi:flagellar motor switch/type III secretory pathway protein FliN
MVPQGSLIVQRALWSLAGEQLDLYRAWHETGPGFWRRLHAIFAVGEQLGADRQEVRDLLLDLRSTTVHAAYVYSLLLHAASPYELSPRQLNQVQRWLGRWSGKVVLSSTRPAAFKLPPLAVDVAGERPGSTVPEESGNLRWLAVDGLAHSLKKRIVSLQKDLTPASLGLGEDCVQPACEMLLRHVYDRCCKGGTPRSQPRSPGTSTTQLVAGYEGIYYQLAGKLFQQPANSEELTKRQQDEIALFGQRATRFEQQYVREQGFQSEQWRIVDESPGGMRLMRPVGQGGQRVAAGQLLALQPPGSAGFRLAAVRWLTLTVSGEMHICMPYSMIEPIKDLLTSSLQAENLEVDKRWIRLMRQQIQMAEVEIIADLGTAAISLRDIVNMRVGDIIPLEIPQSIEAKVDGVPVMECAYGKFNGQYTLRVEKLLSNASSDSQTGEKHV